jgi:hypothetical protein
MGRRHRPRGGRASSPTSRGLPEPSCLICSGSWSPPHRGRALADDLPVSVRRGWYGPRCRGEGWEREPLEDAAAQFFRPGHGDIGRCPVRCASQGRRASSLGSRSSSPISPIQRIPQTPRASTIGCSSRPALVSVYPHVAAVVVPVGDSRPDELAQPLGQQGGGHPRYPAPQRCPPPLSGWWVQGRRNADRAATRSALDAAAAIGRVIPGPRLRVRGVPRRAPKTTHPRADTGQQSGAAGELACRPGSVHPLARAGGHPSRTAVADSLVRSTREHRAGSPQSLAQEPRHWRGSLLTLLRVGFTEPPGSPQALVVSYTTVSPLPPDVSLEAVCFLWHFPAGHPGSALPTTLPCGARTFLDAPGEPEAPRPPGQLARRWFQPKAHRARLANAGRPGGRYGQPKADGAGMTPAAARSRVNQSRSG